MQQQQFSKITTLMHLYHKTVKKNMTMKNKFKIYSHKDQNNQLDHYNNVHNVLML